MPRLTGQAWHERDIEDRKELEYLVTFSGDTRVQMMCELILEQQLAEESLKSARRGLFNALLELDKKVYGSFRNFDDVINPYE